MPPLLIRSRRRPVGPISTTIATGEPSQRPASTAYTPCFTDSRSRSPEKERKNGTLSSREEMAIDSHLVAPEVTEVGGEVLPLIELGGHPLSVLFRGAADVCLPGFEQVPARGVKSTLARGAAVRCRGRMIRERFIDGQEARELITVIVEATAADPFLLQSLQAMREQLVPYTTRSLAGDPLELAQLVRPIFPFLLSATVFRKSLPVTQQLLLPI